MIKKLLSLAGLVLLVFVKTISSQGTFTALSCNQADVNSVINGPQHVAIRGDTILIPACPSGVSWTTPVNVGVGIILKGAGAGHIVAINQDILTISTGTLSITIISTRVDGTYPLGPSPGQTLRVFQAGNRQNWMQGTVTSFNAGTNALVMNITSTSGTTASLQQHHWCIATVPQTVIQDNNATNGNIFNFTEDTVFNTNACCFKITAGATPTANFPTVLSIGFVTGGQAVVIHDLWMESTHANSIESNSNRGLVYNCSFDASPFEQAWSNGGVQGPASTTGINDPITGSWVTPSQWGSADSNGQHSMFWETNDFHAFFINSATDNGGREVFRYNFLDNGNIANHGADSSLIGQRSIEYYNNVGLYHDYGDGHSTWNNANGWVIMRGGTVLIHDNNLQTIGPGMDFSSQPDVKMGVYNLESMGNGNAYDGPCWGQNGTPGQFYHAPRQVGFGYTTGTTPDGKGNLTDGTTFDGDSEPIYAWNNTRILTFSTIDLGNVGSCTNPDTSSNYIIINRDYFVNTAKPSYTPFTYPHPLTGAGSVSVSPTSINFGTVTQFSSSSPQTVTLTNGSGGNITLTGTSVTGTNSGDFSLSSNTCNSGTVVNNTPCTVNVTFTPTSAPTTSETATLNIPYTGATGSPQTVALSGISGSGGSAGQNAKSGGVTKIGGVIVIQ